MDDPYSVGRRDFLKASATAAAVAAAGCGAVSGPWRTLSDEEARALVALCDQIIPSDQDPGAADAGVVRFIDRQLATREKDRREAFRLGLRAVDASARRRGGRPFAELDGARQAALLRDVEAGRVDRADWPGVDPIGFFGLVVDHTMMGYYGDPRHGGNRNRVSWRMLGLPDPPIRGRLHESPPAVPFTPSKR
jgi:gluconate 2-dehydrogenase gamma chain